jgi:ADP-ribose pyrophosphatase
MINNDFFSIETQPFKNIEWIYADAKKVLLIVFGWIDKNDSLVLIRQYRPPVNNWVISAPMGAFPDLALDKLIPIAAKEAEGETGHEIIEIKYFLTIYRSPGLTNEKAYIFLAKYNQDYQGQNLHEDEIIETLYIPKARIREHINQYQIQGDYLDSSILLLWSLSYEDINYFPS